MMIIPDYFGLHIFVDLVNYYQHFKGIKVAELADNCSLPKITIERCTYGLNPKNREFVISQCNTFGLQGNEIIHMAGYLTNLEIAER